MNDRGGVVVGVFTVRPRNLTNGADLSIHDYVLTARLDVTMGFLFAALIGIFGYKAFNTKLFRGEYSLAQAFFGFGVFGGLLVLSIAGSYFGYVLSVDETQGGALIAMRAVAFPVGLYALVTFVGIWRSAKPATWGVKLVSRYLSTFFLGTAAGCILLAWFYILIAVGIYWALRHFQQKASNKALATS